MADLGKRIDQALVNLEDRHPLLQGVFHDVSFDSSALGNPEQRQHVLADWLYQFGGLDFDIELDEELGSGQVLHGRSGAIELTVMRAMTAADTPWRPGERLPLRFPPSAIHLFDAGSGARIDSAPSLLAAE